MIRSAVDLAIGEHAGGSHDSRSAGPRASAHARRPSAAFAVWPVMLEQDLQGVPARGQRRVEVHGPQEGLDRRLCLAQRHVAVAALLVQPAVVRVQLSRSVERCERLRGCAAGSAALTAIM